jgi:hypothetical protein
MYDKNLVELWGRVRVLPWVPTVAPTATQCQRQGLRQQCKQGETLQVDWGGLFWYQMRGFPSFWGGLLSIDRNLLRLGV